MENKLKRTIGLLPAISIGLGAMLGAGIFVFPGLAGGYTGFAAIFSFLIGGVIAILVAVCTAELATAMPESGGGYYFISRSFGSFWGTLVGISQWIGLIFACAFYLVSFGKYGISFFAELEINWNTDAQVLAFSFILILLLINIFGTKKVGRFQNLIVISLSVMLILIFTYGLIDFFGLNDKSIAFSEIAPEGVPSIFTTTALIFTSYLGFVQVANVGAEIKQPNKNLPRSIIWSVLLAIGLYVFIMSVCISTLPQEELKKFGETATIEVARKIVGSWGAIIVVFAGLLAALSSANASIISASRGVFALSKDRLITSKASKINKRFGTPHIALIVVTLPTAVMLIKSELEIFAEVASFLHLLIYGGICLSVIKLRASNPTWYVPTFRIQAAQIIAGLGAISCFTLLWFMQTTSIIYSLGVLLLAVVYYFLFVAKKEIRLAPPKPLHIDLELLNPRILIPINITDDKKDLPHAILRTLPISKLLVLGYREIPEQTDSAQSAKEFKEDGEQRINNITNELKKTKIDFTTKLIFDNEVIQQIKEIIGQENLQFVLTLKPLSNFNQVLIPIYNLSQINKTLSTFIYNLHIKKPTTIKVILFVEKNDNTSNETELKQAIQHQLSLVNININTYEVYEKEKNSSIKKLQKIAKKTDIVIWPEAEQTNRNSILSFIIGKKSKLISSPIVLILKRKSKEITTKK